MNRHNQVTKPASPRPSLCLLLPAETKCRVDDHRSSVNLSCPCRNLLLAVCEEGNDDASWTVEGEKNIRTPLFSN